MSVAEGGGGDLKPREWHEGKGEPYLPCPQGTWQKVIWQFEKGGGNPGKVINRSGKERGRKVLWRGLEGEMNPY